MAFGNIHIDVQVTTANFERKLNEAASKVKTFTQAAETGGTNIDRAFTKAAGGVVSVDRSLTGIGRQVGVTGRLASDASRLDAAFDKASTGARGLDSALEHTAQASLAVIRANNAHATSVERLYLAEHRLAEVESRGTARQSQIIAGRNAVAQAHRNVAVAAAGVRVAEDEATKDAGKRWDLAGQGPTRYAGSLHAAGMASETMFDRVKRNLTKISNLGIGFAVGNVIVSGFRRAVDAIQSTIMAGSDLNETLSKTGFTFGSSSKIVVDLADEMAQKFGLNKREFIDNATSIGLIGKAAGLAQGDAARLGGRFAQLAADASSFYNVPVGDALLAIRSGLVGEAEPMRKFGVLLDETSVKQEGWRLGLAKVGNDLSQQQKVIARSTLIQRGLADATGDLERTQDSLANRLRAISGHVSNFAANIGMQLQPAIGRFLDGSYELAQVLGDRLAPFFSNVGDIALNLRDIFRNLWESIGPLVQALGGLAALGLIQTLKGIAAALEKVTGFLADNRQVVLGLAAVYTASLIPALVRTATHMAAMASLHVISGLDKASTLVRALAGHFVTLAPAATAATAAAAGSGVAITVSQAGAQAALARTSAAYGSLSTAAVLSGNAQVAAAVGSNVANTGLLATLGRVRIGWLGITATAVAAGLVVNRVLSNRRGSDDAKVTEQFGMPEQNDVDQMRERVNELIRLRNKHIDALGKQTNQMNASAGPLALVGKRLMTPGLRADQDQIDAEGRAIQAQLKTYRDAAKAIETVSRQKHLSIAVTKELAQAEGVDLTHGVKTATDSLGKEADAFKAASTAAGLLRSATFQEELVSAAQAAGLEFKDLSKTISDTAMASGVSEEALLAMGQAGIGGASGITLELEGVSEALKAAAEDAAAFSGAFDPAAALGKIFTPLDIGGVKAMQDAAEAVADAKNAAASGDTKSASASNTATRAVNAHKNALDSLATAQEKLNSLRSSGKATSTQIATAEDGVARAMRRVEDTSNSARTAQDKANSSTASGAKKAEAEIAQTAETVRAVYTKTLEQATQFVADLQLATERGLDPGAVAQIMAQGPEQAQPVLKAILGDSTRTTIDIVNLATKALEGITEKHLLQARLYERAVRSSNDQVAKDYTEAVKVQQFILSGGTAQTMAAAAAAAGIGVDELRRILREYGLHLVNDSQLYIEQTYGPKGQVRPAHSGTHAGPGLFAGGIVNPDGSREHFAAGGGREDHTPTVAVGGPIRVWNEPELPWEGYVSGATRYHSRSEMIMGEIAHRLGGVYVPKVEASKSETRNYRAGDVVTNHYAAGGIAGALTPPPELGPEHAPQMTQAAANVFYLKETARLLDIEKLQEAIAANASKPPQPGTPGAAGSATGTGYRLLIDYLRSTGVSHTITSTTGGRHVPGSYHYRGLAVDVVGALSNIYNSFYRVGPQLAELFYDARTSIKHGRNSAPIGGHDDHVHAAVEAATRSLGSPSASAVARGGALHYAHGGIVHGDTYSDVRHGDSSFYAAGATTHAAGDSTVDSRRTSAVWSPSSLRYATGGTRSSVRRGDTFAYGGTQVAGSSTDARRAYSYATGDVSSIHSPSSTHVAGRGPILTDARSTLANYAGNIYAGARALTNRVVNYYAGGGGPRQSPTASARAAVNSSASSPVAKQPGSSTTSAHRLPSSSWMQTVSSSMSSMVGDSNYATGGILAPTFTPQTADEPAEAEWFSHRVRQWGVDPRTERRVPRAQRERVARGEQPRRDKRERRDKFAAGGVRLPVVQVLGAGPLTSGARSLHTSYAYGDIRHGDVSHFSAGDAAGAIPGTATPAVPSRVHVYALGALTPVVDRFPGRGTPRKGERAPFALPPSAREYHYAYGDVHHHDASPLPALRRTSAAHRGGVVLPLHRGSVLFPSPVVPPLLTYALGGTVPVPSPAQLATVRRRPGAGEGRVTHYTHGGLVERLLADRSTKRTEHERLIERFFLGGTPAPMTPVPGVGRFPLAPPAPEPSVHHYYAGAVTRYDHANTFAARVAQAAGIRSEAFPVHVSVADQGGVVYPGTNVVYNNTGAPEFIANPNAPQPQPIRQAPVSVNNSRSTIDARTTIDLRGARVDKSTLPQLKRDVTEIVDQRMDKLRQFMAQGTGAR